MPRSYSRFTSEFDQKLNIQTPFLGQNLVKEVVRGV